MSLSRVTRNYQVTIPSSIRKAMPLHVGDMLDFNVQGKEIVIRLQVVVDPDQKWFWAQEWQEGERAADNDIKNKIV